MRLEHPRPGRAVRDLVHCSNSRPDHNSGCCASCGKHLTKGAWRYKLTGKMVCEKCHEYAKLHEERQYVEIEELRAAHHYIEDVARRE